MKNSFSNIDCTINSREVIERIGELESDLQDLKDTIEVISEKIVEKESELEEAMQDDESISLRGSIAAELVDLKIGQEDKIQEATEWRTSGDGDELGVLRNLAEQCEGVDDWEYGVQLIRDSYFEQAMDEMVAGCYKPPKDLPFWMTITYDYDALKQDYNSVDFDGETYWVR
jgi:hypothetical protein